GGPLSEAATRALRDMEPAAAYVDTVATFGAGHGVSVAVVPVRGARPCAGVRPVGWRPFRGNGVCLVASRGPELLATHCRPLRRTRMGGVATLRLRGATLALGFGDQVLFETAGGGRAAVAARGGVLARVVDDREHVRVPPNRTLVSERPPPGLAPAAGVRPGPYEWIDKTPHTGGTPVPPGRTTTPPAPPVRVAILNGTARSGLAGRTAERIARLPGVDIGRVESAPTQDVGRSYALYADPALAPPARAIAAAAGLAPRRVRRVSSVALLRARGAGDEPVLIVLGADRRMR
ncbi:MAG TPA: LytR C-terminal domain-containing protein, partial [Solirubrobacteraceae bacterium]